jgi:dTDP-4-dehydrorhamnose reductase
MRVLITGASGQVGRSLVNTSPSEYTVHALTREQLDLGNNAQIESCVTALRPDVVINAAAYTAVDRAEADRNGAFAINTRGVDVLAHTCVRYGAKLIHISTDYVFDGQSIRAYEPDAPTHPINIYGASKLAGEQAIANTEKLDWTIVRTAWVYAPWGNNFMLTMLRLFRERGGASVVADQIGAPTSALTLARFLWSTIAIRVRGVQHYTDGGVASWYDFAVAISEEAVALGLLPNSVTVKAISTAEYPTPAKRPALSLLASRASVTATAFEQTHWRVALREVLSELRNH